MINVGIVGSTGYGGCELVRFLLTHPNVNIEWVSSRTYSDQEYSDVYKSYFINIIEVNKYEKENCNCNRSIQRTRKSNCLRTCKTWHFCCYKLQWFKRKSRGNEICEECLAEEGRDTFLCRF